MRWSFLLMTLLLVSGCHNAVVNEKSGRPAKSQSANKGQRRYAIEHDSAPKGPLPTVFQKVKPVDEPFSRYGNPESYAVDGKKYQVLRAVKGYKERGLASWYGTKFHSQRTSSGDDYDMYAMTAAHKTLPIPCYVRIKNLNNGREAVVKVNDRGPFHSDRIIDLSYAAATKLGILPQGTAPVEIEALSVNGKEHVAQYYIQAGAYSSKDLANLLQSKLSKMTTASVVIENHQQRYIVKVGPFGDRNATNRLKEVLASNGIQGAFTMLQ
ncbi:septal ring lytic transglycosylase RlpA family protein [Legionella dresdenensis]|uniref:Endolytic peptidoglycan transglycosylase RlpA n=1 Tax=Legionella dresdenensis TaxID=450200 RepID=A0ABV8CBC9_9GAMM